MRDASSGAITPRTCDIDAALQRLFGRFLARNGTGEDAHLTRPWEPDWASECQSGRVADDGLVRWRPARRRSPDDLADLERALETAVHADIKAFFGGWWSDHLPVTVSGLACDLLFVWNETDLQTLKANVIGHALEKRRVRESLTVFFACVDDYRFFSIDNDSGAVVLETLGRRGPLPVAASLASFLDDARCEDYRPSQIGADDR